MWISRRFYFTKNRFDSPLELTLELLHRWGRFEPWIGVGLSFNVRVFQAEREEVEDREIEFSLGLLSKVGGTVWLDERWGLELEGFYSWVFLGEVVEHEFGAAVGPVLAL